MENQLQFARRNYFVVFDFFVLPLGLTELSQYGLNLSLLVTSSEILYTILLSIVAFPDDVLVLYAVVVTRF